MPVDLFGQMAPIERYRLGDAGHADHRGRRAVDRRAAQIDGEWRMAGEVATIGTFSFFPSKNLGGYGDGGMMVTQDDASRDAARAPAHARRDEAVLPRRSRLQQPPRRAAGGGARAKLPHLAAWSAKRRENAAYYDAAFADLAGDSHAVHRSGERVDLQSVHDSRRAARRAAGASQGEGDRHARSTIRCRCTCSRASRISATSRGQFPESERAAKEVLSLPVYPELTQSQQDEVIEAVRSFFGR